MRVLLLGPFVSKNRRLAPPLGLAYIASCLEQEGYDVKIIDSLVLKYGLKDIINIIKRSNPDVVGISTVTQFISDAYEIARISKEHNPNCLVVLGGPHPTALPIETLRGSKFVDVVVKGEGEITFLELLKNKEKGNFDGIKGICYRINDKIIQNENRPFINDLDNLPFPAYHLLPMNKYRERRKLSIKKSGKDYGDIFGCISSSRGCPYNCSFCASNVIWGRKWRPRSAENIVEEMKLLNDKYHVKKIYFADDLTTLDKKRMEKMCKLIKKEKIDILWSCPSRVNLINGELCYILKKGGCKTIGLGIESGVQSTLDFLNKHITLDQSKAAVKTANKAELQTESNFIIGIPGETKSMINQTISFAFSINLDFVNFSILTPFPGTKIYNYARENNLLLTKDWSKYTTLDPIIKLKNITPFELKLFFIRAHLKSIVNN